MKDSQTSYSIPIALKVTPNTTSIQRGPNRPPNHPIVLEMLGDLDFEADRFAVAGRKYSAALASSPNDVNLLLHLGKCQNELGHLVSARWCFERVLSLEPYNAIASEALQNRDARHRGLPAASRSSAACVRAW